MNPGWVAFNIKENFLTERDGSGFSETVRELTREGTLRMEAYRRYQHRLSIDGQPPYYLAMVARKKKSFPRPSEVRARASVSVRGGET